MHRRIVILLIALAAGLATSQFAAAQDGPSRLFEKPAFDRITLNAANQSKVLNVEPLKIPGRKVPAKPKSSDKLQVRMQGDDRTFELAWGDIERVELFEQMVLAEAEQLTSSGKFDEAYDFIAFLFRNYPTTDGLNEARQNYLFAAAGDAFRRQQLPEALGIAEELHRLNPSFKPSGPGRSLLQVIGAITDKMVDKFVQAKDYRSARTLLLRIAKEYSADKETFVTRWKDKLSGEAGEFRDAAIAALKDDKYVEAYDAWARMTDVWPDTEGAAELSAEMERRYPLVRVAVTHPAREFAARAVGDVAARRAGRLVDRMILEYVGAGTEGGRYISPWGTWEKSDDGMLLSLKLGSEIADETVTGYDFARRLSGLADRNEASYSSAWARLLAGVKVQNVQRIDLELRRPHVLPEAFINISLRTDAERKAAAGQEVASQGPFELLSMGDDQSRFVRNTRLAKSLQPKLAELLERRYEDPKRALLALKRGEVDVVDWVFPGDLAEVKNVPDVVTAPYQLATTHMLIPSKPHPYFANRNFRRCLVTGLDREQILGQALFQGRAPAGCIVVSAPFLAPMQTKDPRAYAYDAEDVKPRAFDPRLALALRMLAAGEMKVEANRIMAEPAKLEPIVLGCPADETSRIACRAILQQWKIIGLEAKIIEFPAGVFTDKNAECHLVYTQAAMWEPLVDARRLLSLPEVAPFVSTHVLNTLQRIEAAKNWRDGREWFRELHRLLNEELPVLPLWQTVDYYAYRSRIRGIRPDSVTLYQNVEDWQVGGGMKSP